MLSLSRGLRLALVVALGLGTFAFNPAPAYADDDEEEEDDGGDDEGGDGDDEGGDDESEDEEEGDSDQPPVTAGGLYTLKTFPVRELERPLTLTEGILQIRAGAGVDVSDKGAFESFGVNLEGEYGLRDNVTAVFGFTNAYNFAQFNVYAGLEAALAYDLVNFRTALRLQRFAIPEYEDFDDGMGGTVNLPNGQYSAGDIGAGIDLGFPFRYVAKPEIAIVALDTLMTIDLDGTKPDLNPSLGISTNPVAPVSVVIFATLQIRDFDTTNQFTVPATARIQFSPSRKLDLGAEFTFLNVKPPDGQNFYDNRYLTLYAQFRAGR